MDVGHLHQKLDPIPWRADPPLPRRVRVCWGPPTDSLDGRTGDPVKRLLLLLALAAPSVALAKRFEVVDFKYTSNHQIAPAERFVSVAAAPSRVGGWLADKVMAAGGAVYFNRPNTERIDVPPGGEVCWNDVMEITRAEWRAFEDNNLRVYEKIDRTSPRLAAGCSDITITQGADIAGWAVKIELDSRKAQTTLYDWHVVGPAFWMTPNNISTQFTSRVTFIIWPEGADSRVYAWGVPTNADVEAAPGNSIGRAWWQASDGSREAELVRYYLTAVKEASW